MAKRTSSLMVFPFFFVFLSTAVAAPPSYFQCRSVVSCAHPLMIRVANQRTARGDLSGSERAQLIGKKLERGIELGLWRSMWLVGRDYAENFAWRDILQVYGAVSDVTELLRLLVDLNRMDAGAKKAAWVRENYQNVLTISKSLFTRILKLLNKSEKLRKVLDAVQIEVDEGGLLRDFLELWINDLKDLIQISNDLKDLIQMSNDLGIGLQFCNYVCISDDAASQSESE